MRDNRKQIMTLLLTAAGAGAAYFVTRAVVNRVRAGARSRSDDWHSRALNQGQTPRQEARSAQMRGYQTRDRVEDRPTRARSSSQQLIDQPDRQPIPNTGQIYGTAEMSGLLDVDVPPVSVEDQVGPLAQYLLAFHNLIEMLRERRAGETGTGSGMGRSLKVGDRARFEDELQRLDEMLPEYGEGNLEENSLQERVYKLIWKVRDGLQNLNYGDDDLFRINGEVRSEACRLMRDIRSGGFETSEDFEEAFQVYECG